MQIPAGTSERVAWVVLIGLGAGYMIGAWLNRQRGQHLSRWLRSSLDKLGGRSGWKVIRSVGSAAQLNVVDASAPFRQIQITYALLTRELPVLWGIEWLRGRRDTLAVRADLRSEPDGEIEVVPQDGALRHQIDRLAGEHPWEWQPGPCELAVGTRGPIHSSTVVGVHRFLENYGLHLQRLSVRPFPAAAGTAVLNEGPEGQVGLKLPTVAAPRDLTNSRIRPHLLLFLNLGTIERAPASRFYDDLRSLARSTRAAQ